MTTAQDHYVISLKHTRREHRYITIWRSNNCGYCWPLAWAGKYSRESVMESLDYYNGGGNLAVPCSVLDAVAVPPIPGYVDNDAGPCIENTRANWSLILANLIAEPKYKPQPEFKGARRIKEAA